MPIQSMRPTSFSTRLQSKPTTPLNRIQNIRHLANDTYIEHPTINNYALHVMGWLDVAAEPMIVSVPDMDKGRDWILHTLNMDH